MILKRKSKILSMLLTMAMLFMLWSGGLTVWADTGSTVSVASEGELRNAIINASDGDIISIDKDIALTGDLSIDKSITLTSDNPSTLNAQDNYLISIPAGKDVTFGGKLIVEGSYSPVIGIAGSFTMAEKAAVKQTNATWSRPAISISSNGTATITGNSKVESTDTGINNLGKLSVSGGTVNGNTFAIKNYGTLTVTNGGIGSIDKEQIGIVVYDGIADISGGSILGKGFAVFVGNIGTLSISGGSFAASSNADFALQCAGATTITGGSFSTGKIGTTTANGTIHIDKSGGGSGSLTLPATGVFYSDSGVQRNYLTALPGAITATVGQQTDVSLTGSNSGVLYAVIGGTDAELRASGTGTYATGSGSTVVANITPSSAGSYNLVLTAAGTGAATTQSLKLTLPVTVSDTAANVCEIGSTGYTSLGDALAAVASGQTIRMLSDITYTEPIEVNGKVITFDLGNYNISLNTSANVAKHDNPALMVTDGGKVRLAGTGKFNVKGYFTGVDVVGANSEATVNNVTVTATGACAVYMIGSGMALDGGKLTVNGDIKAEASNSVGIDVNAKNGKIIVNGDIAAGQAGIYTSTNPGTEVTVNGNLSVADPGTEDQLQGIRAYGLTTVKVTGNVSVSGANCIGVYAIGGTIIVNGNVTSSGIGAKAIPNSDYENGMITIDGCLSAGSPFIIVGGSEKNANQNTLPTTKEEYLTYTDGKNTVWVKVPSVSVWPAGSALTAGETTATSTVLSWTAATGAIDYVIYKNYAFLPGVPQKTQTHTVTGLSPDTEYTFQVQAAYYDVALKKNTWTTDGPTVKVRTSAPLPKEPTPNATFTAAEADSGTLANLLPEMRYSVDGGSSWLTISGSSMVINDVTAANGIQVKKLGNGTTTSDSDIQIITITKAATPTGLSKANCTTDDQNDGKLLGLTDAMEYKLFNEVTWASGTGGDITGLASGRYLIRVKAAGTVLASENAELVIASYAPTTHSKSSKPSTPIYKADVKTGNNAGTTIPVVVDKNAGTALIDAGSLDLAQGETVITVPSIPDVDTYLVGIPVPDLSTAKLQGTLTIDTDMGSVTVPSNMLTGVAGIKGDKAVISIGEGDKAVLRPDVKTAVGNRSLVQLTLSIDGKQTDWNNPKVPVSVSIPYKPTATELANSESIIIWCIDGSGNTVTVPNGHYNPVSGTVDFTATHFGEYAVGYNKVSFNDVASNAWYSKAISFIAARGITSGTGNGNYNPDAKLTRGEFIVLMMKAYGIAPDVNPADNFADAGNTYYTGYLRAAKRLGIAAGVGNNLYAPGKEITRQEMFTLLYNALKTMGQLPQSSNSKMLSDFNDANQVAAWAADAMTALVKAGTVTGSNGRLNPTGTTTRAEMAQVLYNLLLK